jgi:hypothetical protein
MATLVSYLFSFVDGAVFSTVAPLRQNAPTVDGINYAMLRQLRIPTGEPQIAGFWLDADSGGWGPPRILPVSFSSYKEALSDTMGENIKVVRPHIFLSTWFAQYRPPDPLVDAMFAQP